MTIGLGLALVLAGLVGCDDGGTSAAQAGDAAAANVDAGGPAPDAGPEADAGADLGSAADAAALLDAALPDAALPELDAAVGAVVAPADPRPYSGGACPTFEAGRNIFTAGGRERTFNLYLPDEPAGAPLLFMWHPLGSNAGQIGSFLRASEAARTHGFVIAAPESLRTQTEWGYVGAPTDDLALFDDLYACLTAQFDLDRTRTYTTGFSAGALWSSYLVVHRAEYLTAALILSGGTNAFLPYRTPAYRLPVLLAWGGPTDQYGGVVDFQASTYHMRDRLRADGHVVVTCEHAGGHVPPPGVTTWGYAFLAQHTLRDGQSPITAEGLGPAFPETCVIVP